MKFINSLLALFLVITFMSVSLKAQINPYSQVDLGSLENIRINYYASLEDDEILDKLVNTLETKYGKVTQKYPILIMAYYGGLLSIKSKNAFWPFTKLSYFNESMELMTKAVALSPENLEIRFIRFAILHHIPGFLGHSEEKKEDAEKIYSLIQNQDYTYISSEIQKGIAEFLVSTERISKDKVNNLLKIYPQLALK
ncbi:MAG: hypothetical protein M0P71_04175 [Melioribacteraceae bacterium]|nr:hypothetical protein [Melioribacteraceae bacterium]